MIQTFVKFLVGMTLMLTLALSFSLPGVADPNPPGCAAAEAAVRKAQADFMEARKAFFEAEDNVRKKKNEIKALNIAFSKAEKAAGLALLELDAVNEDKAACDYWTANPDSPAPLFDCGEIPERLQKAQEKVENTDRDVAVINAQLDKEEAELARLEDLLSIARQRKDAALRAIKEAKDAWAALGCHLHA